MAHRREQSQVLQEVFDEVAQALRVKFDAAGLEVSIDASLDSIRIGDGTDTVTITVVGGKKALDVSVADITLDHSNDSIRLGDGTDLADVENVNHSVKGLAVASLVPKVRTTSNGGYEYTGLAAAGSLTSQARWRIIREDANGNIDHAGGNNNFVHVWDDVLTLSYS